MDARGNARGNKLSSCQIPDQYLKKQKSSLWLKKKEKRKKKKKQRIEKSCYHNSKNLRIFYKDLMFSDSSYNKIIS